MLTKLPISLAAGLMIISAAGAQQGTPPPAVQPAAPSFAQADARAVVEALAAVLDANFLYPDVAKRYAAGLRAKLAAGGYSQFADGDAFAAAVTADLQAISPDRHLRVMSPAMIAKRGGGRQRRDGAPFSAVRRSGWIAPEVAYIDFAGFPGNATTLDAVRAFLATHGDAKTLIIDARGNGGGGLDEMDLIFAQLFSAPTALVTMDTRVAVERSRGNPFEGLATLKLASAPEGVVRRVHSALPAATATGLRNAKVYLLTSKKTFSAAEHFSLSLKRTGRATLIGEATGGGAHYGGVEQLPAGFAAFVPVGRTFNPDNGEEWEVVGVAPHIAVPAEKALDEALRLAGVSATGEVALAALR